GSCRCARTRDAAALWNDRSRLKQTDKTIVVFLRHNLSRRRWCRVRTGRGQFAVVRSAKHKQSGEHYAVKIIDKHRTDHKQIEDVHVRESLRWIDGCSCHDLTCFPAT